MSDFAKYRLKLHADKTRLVRFMRPPQNGRQEPPTLVFLGFTHVLGKSPMLPLFHR